MMRQFACVMLLMAAAFPARAADDAKPNTLTPKEIADGWVLLFDGETNFSWQSLGDAKVKDGVLSLEGKKGTTLFTTTGFGPVELRLDCRWSGKDRPTFYLPGLREKADSILGVWAKDKWATVTVQLTKQPKLMAGRMRWEAVYGINLKGAEAAGTFAWFGPNQPDHIGFEVPAGSVLELRNVKLKPSATKPIFNGKDLTGWKEFPGKKSKFTVTKEGWLNLKNGPGDLQTTGQYDDFVLQLDCISNGKHLNSGVFFRCQPDKYQQGYEAQIHNGFTAKPKKEYAIEEYDPKTNKLKETKKVKYTAVDYGTGGIYRRMPARKEVAKDHEWFTMTVAAHGRHMAVWVNGVQVTDWTDNRPLKDNARNGCRLEKGAISLQGHDPTTDLSFRNIRMAELPRK